MSLRMVKPTLSMGKEIHQLINTHARIEDTGVLPRSLKNIYEDIRDFTVCLDGDKIVGHQAKPLPALKITPKCKLESPCRERLVGRFYELRPNMSIWALKQIRRPPLIFGRPVFSN